MRRVRVLLPRGLLVCSCVAAFKKQKKVRRCPRHGLWMLDPAWQPMFGLAPEPLAHFGTQPGGQSSRWHLMAHVPFWQSHSQLFTSASGKRRASYLGCRPRKARSPDFLGHLPQDLASGAMMFKYFRTSGVEPCGHLAAAEAAIQAKQLHLEVSEPWHLCTSVLCRVLLC